MWAGRVSIDEQEVVDFVAKLLVRDPLKRLTADQALHVSAVALCPTAVLASIHGFSTHHEVDIES